MTNLSDKTGRRTKLEVNENILKITGSASLPEKLDLSKDYKLMIEGSVYKVEYSDNQDGTLNRIHKLKLITGEIETEKGWTKLKDKTRWSQKLRVSIFAYGQEHFPEIDEEQFYESVMRGLVANADQLITSALKSGLGGN